jgi:hypothetical protein
LVLIEDSDADLLAVLTELGLPAPLAAMPAADLAPQLDRLRVQLAALRDHPHGRPDAGASTVVGRFHFPLRPTIYFAFLATVKAMGAVMALMANPTAGGITAAIVILDTAEKAQQLISRLDEVELRAIEALSTAVSARQPDDPLAGTASLAEIEAVLARRGGVAAGLAQTLHLMAEERRGVRRFTFDGGTRYELIA